MMNKAGMPLLLGSFALAWCVACPVLVRAGQSLAKQVGDITPRGNVDPVAKGRTDADIVQITHLETDLPAGIASTERFFKIAIKPGSGGYPGAQLAFTSPVNVAENHVFAIWFKSELPITYFSLGLTNTSNVEATYNFHTAAITPYSEVRVGTWQKVYVPVNSYPYEVRPRDRKMDFSQIRGLTFYAFDETLSTKHPIYEFSFGGMEILTIEEAREEFPKTIRQPKLASAKQLFRDSDSLIWTVDVGEKIWKNSVLPEGVPSASAATASAAGNEFASLLFVVNSTRGLRNVTTTATDLVCGEHRIPASEITLRYVDTVPNVLFDAPDPLPRLQNRAVSVRAGENLQLWTTVYVPPRTLPGTYSGTIVLEDAQDFKKSLPIQLEVYGFSLPREMHLQSMYTIQDLYGSGPTYMAERSERQWGRRIEPFSTEYEAVVRNIIRNFGEHRVTPQLDIANWFDFIKTQERLALHDKYGFNPAFILGMNIANEYAAAEPVTLEKREKLRKHWKAEAERYKAAGLAGMTIVKIDDEAAGERLKYSLMAAEDARAEMPFIQNFMTVTGRSLPKEFFGLIDTWCPVWGVLDFESEQVKERKAAGDRFWVYGVEYKYNFAYEPIDLRAPYWLYWKYGISGTHYSHGQDEAYLTYPNATYPQSDGLEVIPSIRWEMIRHGAQDYEYLWMLNDLINANPDYGRRYRELLEVPEELAAGPSRHTDDPRRLLERRAQIAKAIEEMILRNMSQ